MRKWTRSGIVSGIVLGISLAAVGAISFNGARSHQLTAVQASSHRDAPFISEDPAADNTDVYAFVSTETGRSDYVTLIANYVPLQNPANGPNFYKLSDYVTYDINIDTDGDGLADLTYRFEFTTHIVDPGTYLYNTGTILPPPNPDDPTSQYVNLNQPQSYTLTEIIHGKHGNGNNGNGNGGNGNGDNGSNGNGNGNNGNGNNGNGNNGNGNNGNGNNGNRGDQETVLLTNVRTAPNNPGPKSINASSAATARQGGVDPGDDSAAYANLAQMAVHPVPNFGGGRAFVGPRAEGFYVDLGTSFDLINPHAQGLDGTSGENVSTLAVEVPKSRFQAAGDTDGIIGVWATASRVAYPVCQSQDDSTAGSNGQDGSCNVPVEHGPDKGVQVSRLSNPLFNEFLDPLKAKDLYNATRPDEDMRNIYPGILNPATAQGPNTLTEQLREFTKCTDTMNHLDQVATWMQGYPAGVVNGFPGNRGTQTANPAIADEMRLNFNIPPSPVENRLGVLAGDFAGMPNGRRVGDDAVDIDLHIWGGQIQSNFGGTACPAAAALTDGVNGPDVPFLTAFPYLANPHAGYDFDVDTSVAEPGP